MKKNKIVTFKIDGRTATAQLRSPVIEAAQSLGIEIPNLCHQSALNAYGACRLCLVEVKKGKRTRVVTSCTYPAEQDIEVFTNTERVKKLRKEVIELILARCPEVDIVKKLAATMGVTKPRFKTSNDDCILCGLCVRACRDLVGVSAISFANRGRDREIITPYREHSEDCIGCGVCVVICPTGAVKMEDKNGKRTMRNWNTEFVLKPCSQCTTPFITVKHLELLKKKINLPDDILNICPECRIAVFGQKAISAFKSSDIGAGMVEFV